jgi:hypothetical protein
MQALSLSHSLSLPPFLSLSLSLSSHAIVLSFVSSVLRKSSCLLTSNMGLFFPSQVTRRTCTPSTVTRQRLRLPRLMLTITPTTLTGTPLKSVRQGHTSGRWCFEATMDLSSVSRRRLAPSSRRATQRLASRPHPPCCLRAFFPRLQKPCLSHTRIHTHMQESFQRPSATLNANLATKPRIANSQAANPRYLVERPSGTRRPQQSPASIIRSLLPIY